MGISVENYRMRIGSHANFVQARKSMFQLKGKFWNQILIMFYLKVFYLPCLKNLVKQTEKNNEVFMWYAQIVCYNVYVPLLLRLSNDVEENPGPTNVNEIVDPTFTVCADFNQGNASMFGSNAGKQCVAMSIYAILYNEIKSINTWAMTIGANTVAVFMPFPDVFKIFDSHSLDRHGMQFASGYSVLISVEGLQNLVNFFRLTRNSDSQNFGNLFELKGVKCYKNNDLSNSLTTGNFHNTPTKQNELSKENTNIRLAKQRGWKAAQRKIESAEKKEKRLLKCKAYQRARRQNESVVEKEKRLAKERDYRRAQRKNETSEQRKQRLAKVRAYKNSTKETSSSTKVHQQQDDELLRLIDKFHKSVSTGPLYICSCCDQLWYKHSVCPADRLRLSNTNSVDYLQGIKSVDNIEWLCLTCNNHLKKKSTTMCNCKWLQISKKA